MKYNPFKIILWTLFAVFVLLNSLRLFIYGFIISFIIVIIDRAFFGTRTRSDRQFLNLFFTATSILALFYTFSPYFRSFEFRISHPRWQQLEIVSVEKGVSQHVSTSLNMMEKVYTPLEVKYKDEQGKLHVKSEEVKHYAILGFSPVFDNNVIEKELDYIHQRGLNKLIDKKAIHLFQHPSKDKMKVFKGNDAFALRHSIGSQIGLLLVYVLFAGLTVYCIVRLKMLKRLLGSEKWKERKTAYIILSILFFSYIVVGITVIHYMKFKVY